MIPPQTIFSLLSLFSMLFSFQVIRFVPKKVRTTKILIIIRNQWDVLESLYTYRISNKGVEWRSFSTFVKQTVATPEKIDKWGYLELVTLHLRLFGRKNVLILPLEMLETSPQEFLNRISPFSL